MCFCCYIVFFSDKRESSCNLASQLHFILEDAGATLASGPVKAQQLFIPQRQLPTYHIFSKVNHDIISFTV